MKKVAIMQPYFLPYIGYFQLMNYVDEFVIYDNIEYTKKGWINRNRMLQQGKDVYFTLPLKKDSDYLNVNKRFLADSYGIEQHKILNKIRNNYHKAPYFLEIYTIMEEIFLFENPNLFEFINSSILKIKKCLEIKTPIIKSSSLEIDDNLKARDKVIALTKKLKGTEYINPIGGKVLYDKQDFLLEGIKLSFLRTSAFEYNQFKNTFIPHLSILDVLMFNGKEETRNLLNKLELE